ncbi:MAG: hypothetical protein IJC66_08210, partial [Kiritimatiellae bacterium]|nr:hypothetical protein [Kiritimatiellia bacterium]
MSRRADVGVGSFVPVACLSRIAIALYRMSVLYFGDSSGRHSASQPRMPALRPTTFPASSNLRRLSTWQ